MAPSKSKLLSQEQHGTALSQRPDAIIVEAGSSYNGYGSSRPSVVEGDDESTIIAMVDGWRKLLKMMLLAIGVRIVGIFKPQNGVVTRACIPFFLRVLRPIRRQTMAQGDSEEGDNISQNDFNSSRDVGEEPPVTPLHTISQTRNTSASNASALPSRGEPMANLSNIANEASTAKLPFSPPSTSAYQTDCTFTPTIWVPPSYDIVNAASTANTIYQIGCNVAPNIFASPSYNSANAAPMANPIYQIGCNFTPNISVPLSYSSTNATSTANSCFYPPPIPNPYQIGCRFAPTIFASSSYDSANAEENVNASYPPKPPIVTSLSTTDL